MYTAEMKLGGCWFGKRQVPRQLHKNIKLCMAEGRSGACSAGPCSGSLLFVLIPSGGIELCFHWA